MPRQSRIDTAGALHHIIARGIERRKLFDDQVMTFCSGELFGLAYSSVSQRIRVFSESYGRGAALKTAYKKLKSQTKVTPFA